MIVIAITLELQEELRKFTMESFGFRETMIEIPLPLLPGVPTTFGEMLVGAKALVVFRQRNRFLLVETIKAGTNGVAWEKVDPAEITNFIIQHLMETYSAAIVLRFPSPNHARGDMVFGSYAQEAWYKALRLEHLLAEGDIELRVRYPEGMHGFMETDDPNWSNGDPPEWEDNE